MSNIQSYRDLLIWQKSMTRKYPDSERYGLVSQTQRSAVSVPSNIAEGYGRNSTSDYIRFLRIASGSLYELQTQLEIAKNLNFLPHEDFVDLHSKSEEIAKMLNGLIRKIETSKR
jgi:four helix bundle protein